MKSVTQLVNQVSNVTEAQEVISNLLMRFASEAAFQRMEENARYAHKTVSQQAQRASSNLLTSFVLTKPGGCV